MDSEVYWKLGEPPGLKSCGQQHKVQLQACHQECAPGVDTGANII